MNVPNCRAPVFNSHGACIFLHTPLYVALALLSMIAIGCDSTGGVENCVADTSAAAEKDWVRLYDNESQPAKEVGTLDFYQNTISYSGSNCQRPNRTVTTMTVWSKNLWNAVSFSYRAEFQLDSVGWSVEGSVEEVQPLHWVDKGVVATDAASLYEGTLSGRLTGPVRYSEPEMPTYVVTSGACGHIVFWEHLASNFDSAYALFRERERDLRSDREVKFEVKQLEVADENGRVPETDFYAIRIVDAETGHIVHSVSDVISSKGDLYRIAWCPD